MLFYSKSESEVLGVPFGRIEINENFDEWDNLKEEIAQSPCKYIRVKIKNPQADELDQLFALAPKAHLLEILRVYRSEDLRITPFENAYSDLKIFKVDESLKDTLGQFILDTYEDIPFGNYTPKSIRDIFPVEKQLKSLIDYFRNNYAGQDIDKVAYLYYNQSNKLVACLISEYIAKNKSEHGTYSYYAGVAKDERNKGIQYKILNHSKFYITERNYAFFYAATRLTNLYSAKAVEKNDFKCIGYDWVYLLEK